MKLKQFILRVFFAAEIVAFAAFYLFGPHGLKALVQLQNENALLLHDIAQCKQEIKNLENDIAHWQENDFYKEKCAREQLHMSRKDEIVYYLP